MRDKEFITTMAASNAIGIAATSVRTSLLNLIHSRLSCDSKMWFIWFIASWFICLFVDLYLFIFLFILLFIHTHKLKRLRGKGLQPLLLGHWYSFCILIYLFIYWFIFVYIFVYYFVYFNFHAHPYLLVAESWKGFRVRFATIIFMESLIFILYLALSVYLLIYFCWFILLLLTSTENLL